MSDTPRTDAETMRDEYDHVDTEFGPFAPSVTVGADFARQLERELTEALEWKRMLSSWGGTPEIVDSFIKGQQDRIAAAQETEKQRDEWKELYKRLNESLASNKRLFSNNLAEKAIDYQAKRIKFLEDRLSETQKELLELKGGKS